MKKLFFLYLLLPAGLVAQIEKKFELGVAAGYGLNNGSLFTNYTFSEHFMVTGDFGMDKNLGFSAGAGAYCYPFKFSKFRPLIGATYTWTTGGQNGYGPEDKATIIKVDAANFITPSVGLRYNGLWKDSTTGHSCSLVFKVGYKISTGAYPYATYTKGPPLPHDLDRVNNYIDNGIVGYFCLIISIPKRKKLK